MTIKNIKPNRFFLLLILCIELGCINSSNSKQENKKVQPNIIYIMSDDHAQRAISAYGPDLNKTPNIDRIAKEGAIFKNSFVSNSICAPSRAVMLTGKFSHLNGQTDNLRSFDGSQQTYPKILQANGYQTALIGKWHLKSDPTGFDFWSVHIGQGDYYNPDFKEMGKTKRYKGYSPDIVKENGINWLENRDKEKPFAMLLHFKAPHRNWMPALSKLEMYEDKEFDLPSNFFDNYENRGRASKEQEMSIYEDMELEWDLKMNGAGTAFEKEKFERKLSRFTTEERQQWDAFYNKINEDFKSKNPQGKDLAIWKYQRYLRDYLKVVSSVDDNIGDVLNYLDEHGLAENTIVVYTSDQGFYMGEHGWFDKRFMYEESLRTPLLIRYPAKIKPKTVVNGMVQNIDYAPTFLDYAGIDTPSGIQGESIRPLLEGKKDEIRDAIFYQYFEYPGPHAVKRHFGIRTSRYKLIHFYYDVDEWEFYDLEKDPNEMKNQYANPNYKAIIKELKIKLKDLRTKYKDSDDNNFKIQTQDLKSSKG
ncbi:sulfatase [Tamlana sp. 2201CG12-4]|uniref:sulfatase family protein n=1 Tax=Tamlana sp. 2201CG12-4 TaxID=3112582 RepID=UPI002DB5D55C|nr:sulfatase [Tamlana sp. 2201CG12-4]MEC3908650.1 sulfatase [Tamlana sp. 2201CG12-4]